MKNKKFVHNLVMLNEKLTKVFASPVIFIAVKSCHNVGYNINTIPLIAKGSNMPIDLMILLESSNLNFFSL